ncbi:hypothetical protein HY491_01300 [Candidatus Woesearchaeota archaeon]|nr:hypothetical protein [Candidatus Woesearchaeota archaeon]
MHLSTCFSFPCQTAFVAGVSGISVLFQASLQQLLAFQTLYPMDTVPRMFLQQSQHQQTNRRHLVKDISGWVSDVARLFCFAPMGRMDK